MVSMGKRKKVLAKSFFLWLPYAAKQAQKIRNLFSCHSLAVNQSAFNLIGSDFAPKVGMISEWFNSDLGMVFECLE
jgi:hypothetical protein